MLHDEGLDDYLCRVLHLDEHEPDLTEWRALVERVRSADQEVHIGLVGKYINLPDAYLSVVEALKHGGYASGAKVVIDWIAADDTEGLLAEGTPRRPRRHRRARRLRRPRHRRQGRGRRVRARARRARTSGCASGCSAAVIEFARDVCGLAGANSASSTRRPRIPVIDLMDEQKSVVDMGGTMRLGAYPAKLEPGSRVRDIYGEEVVYERHRHRYELNNRYRQTFEEHGLRCSGTSPDGLLVEFVELVDHPVLRRDAGAPRVQEPPEPAAPAVRRVRGSRAPAGRRSAAAPARSDTVERVCASPERPVTRR